MPLELRTSNFANWKKQSANYYYPKDADGDNHIHVSCEKIDANTNLATIKAVSIKIDGTSTNLRPTSALKQFKFEATTDTKFPVDPLGAAYKKALKQAGLTS